MSFLSQTDASLLMQLPTSNVTSNTTNTAIQQSPPQVPIDSSTNPNQSKKANHHSSVTKKKYGNQGNQGSQKNNSRTFLETLIDKIEPGNFIVPNSNIDKLLQCFPKFIQEFFNINDHYLDNLIEMIVDKGRIPYFYYSDHSKKMQKMEIRSFSEKDFPPLQQNFITKPKETVCTNDDNFVKIDDVIIQHILSNIGEFTSSDNRAGIEGTLHRISRKLNRNDQVIGLTIRVGRSIDGLYKLLEKELLDNKSILLVGKPGSGKTTFLRDCCKFLSNTKRVEIVDSSNEIAGHSDIPHDSIGYSRRMMVVKRSFQHQIMLETVQNHSPETLVIDEIGSSLEVSASRDISQRGVQLIATCHGSTSRDIVNSPVLTKLLGDTHSVILSGKEMADKQESQRSIRERMGESCFHSIVEIHKPGVIVYIPNAAKCVDAILNRKPYNIEIRVLKDDYSVETTQSSCI